MKLSLLLGLPSLVWMLAACGAAEADPEIGQGRTSVATSCSDADLLAVQSRIKQLFGSGPTGVSNGVLYGANTHAADFIVELLRWAHQTKPADPATGLENLSRVTHAFSRSDFTIARLGTQFFPDTSCKIDSDYLLADGDDLRDDFDEDQRVDNQVYHTLVYIYGGYFAGPLVLEEYNTLHETLDIGGHIEDFWVGDAGIALGTALRDGKAMNEELDLLINTDSSPQSDFAHKVAYERIRTMLADDRNALFSTRVTWDNFADVASFVLSDPSLRIDRGIRDADWIRCADESGCSVSYGPTLDPLSTDVQFLGSVPAGTVMGVFATYGGRAVVSYPMADRGSAVQIVNHWGGGWINAGSAPHGAPPTADLAVRWRFCADSSCTVSYTRRLEDPAKVLGSVPRCTKMGVFVDGNGLDVVSYPMWDRGGAVQVVPNNGSSWLSSKPSGCP